jgi:hypothetical protein
MLSHAQNPQIFAFRKDNPLRMRTQFFSQGRGKNIGCMGKFHRFGIIVLVVPTFPC